MRTLLRCLRFEHYLIIMFTAGLYTAIAAQLLHMDGKAYQAAGALIAFIACNIGLTKLIRRDA